MTGLEWLKAHLDYDGDVAWQTIGNVQRRETWKTGQYAGGLPRSNFRVATVSRELKPW